MEILLFVVLGAAGISVAIAGWLILMRQPVGTCQLCDKVLYTQSESDWHKAANCVRATDEMNQVED